MPYVEGFGTWPFGEEWLWEAVATVYLPLLDVIADEPVTVGLTPVLCDQLEALAGDARGRFVGFLDGIRAEIHAEDAAGLERAGEHELADEVRRAAGDYVAAERAFHAIDGDLLGAFGKLAEGRRAELWAGPATHPVLPLLATDAGLRLQLGAGTASHERRFGAWGGGLWLPECAYEPGLDRELAEHGVRAFCVDQTDGLGLGAPEQLEPVATEAGPVAVPIDWRTIALVWDSDAGYPTSPAYRDHHHRTVHDLKPWSNAGEPYDHAAAMRLAGEHARDFVARAIARLDAYRAERGRPGLICCALDAELLGHWWYEGPAWLRGVFEAAREAGLALATLPDALERFEPVERPLAASSWGMPKDLSTWDSPRVAELAFAARSAELRIVAAAQSPAVAGEAAPAERRAGLERAARELLALQSSDWAFQVTRELAGTYPLDRAHAHAAGVDAALRPLADSRSAVPPAALRNLTPDLELSLLTAP
jgi:1,4-alpha-glucan branching enzyme